MVFKMEEVIPGVQCWYPSFYPLAGLHPDIFVPQRWIQPDKLLHQPYAFLILEHLDGNATGAEGCKSALSARVASSRF